MRRAGARGFEVRSGGDLKVQKPTETLGILPGVRELCETRAPGYGEGLGGVWGRRRRGGGDRTWLGSFMGEREQPSSFPAELVSQV